MQWRRGAGKSAGRPQWVLSLTPLGLPLHPKELTAAAGRDTSSAAPHWRRGQSTWVAEFATTLLCVTHALCLSWVHVWAPAVPLPRPSSSPEHFC